MAQTTRDGWIDVRRDLHRHPEPAWCEFYTTSRIVDELERIGVDEIHVGPDAIATDRRLGVPDDDEIEEWYRRAREAGAREDVLEKTEGGYTGVVAVHEAGDGPTIALRVDIDALSREESTSDDHVPAAEGFRSENEGAMHACGHDAHATIGLGVLEAIVESDFSGTLKVVFQPAEEEIGGGKAIAESGHLDDVDYLLAIHVGLDHPTGEIVAGIDGFLAVSNLDIRFEGEPAHAGARPESGRNAVQAMATAIQNLYAIPRHSRGTTRVNAGKVGGGSASNIIPESAFIEGEVRGETTELMEYVRERAKAVVENAAEMHGCSGEMETIGEAPSAESDQGLVSIVGDVAEGIDGVENVLERGDLGASEDATFLMRRVQSNGGLATFVGVGTDHPGGHHTATFDVDEESIGVGIRTLSAAIREIATERP